MSNVFNMPPPSRPITTMHRFMMARVQDLCIDVNLQTEQRAWCEYASAHRLHVHIVPPEHQSEERGGDNTFHATWSRDVRLPPNTHVDPDEALRDLSEIITHLESLLPGHGLPGGAA